MNLQLTTSHFEKIVKGGYSLDIIFLLKLVEEDYDLSSFTGSSEKLKVMHQTIIRKGLMTEEGKLTLSGKEVLSILNVADVEKIDLRKKTDITDDFEKWWKAYPGTDTFEYAGKKFTGTRALRAKKDECKVKLYKILDEGDYTIDELIAALKYEVNQKINNSMKTSSNKLSFMQNSLTYLNQRTFEPFIELVREGNKQEIEAPITGGIDI